MVQLACFFCSRATLDSSYCRPVQIYLLGNDLEDANSVMHAWGALSIQPNPVTADFGHMVLVRGGCCAVKTEKLATSGSFLTWKIGSTNSDEVPVHSKSTDSARLL